MTVMTSDLKETLHRLPRTLRVGSVPGGLCEYLFLQDAIDYADSQGGDWTIEIYSGSYNEGDITNSGAANITLKAMGEGRVVIAPAVAPVTAVIVSGFTLRLEGIIVTAPDATRPALRVTGGTCSAGRCEFNGVGAGDAVQQVGGTLNVDLCFFNQGNISLSTALCSLMLRRSRILNGNLNTAGAFAHTVRTEYVDFNNNNFNNLATGATVVEIEACSELNTFTDASLLGTVSIRRSNLVSAVKNGTSPWLAYGGRFGLLANNNAVGAIAIFNGFVFSIVRAIGSIVQWQDENTLKVIPSGTTTDPVIGYAITAAGAGDVILVHPGTYDEFITCVAGVNIKGIGARGSVIIQQNDANIITLATNVELSNLTIRLVAPSAARLLVYDGAAACTATLRNINFEITTPGAYNHTLMRFYGAGNYIVEGCFANISAAGATFYTVEHDQNAGIVHLFNNDFTAATGYHIRSGVAGVITGGTNRWAGACHMFSVTLGTITLDKDAIVCTGSVSGDVSGGAVVCRNGENSFEVYEGMMIQHALTACAAGGEVLIHAGSYAPTANLTVAANTLVRGEGKATIITPTGAAITNGMVLNGDNITVKDLKIILAAGAGAVNTRPNVIYASSRTLIWLENLWLVGDTSVADDGSEGRQNGVHFTGCTECKIIDCRAEDSKRCGIHLLSSSNNNTIVGNTCQGNTNHGIRLATTSNNNTITGNTCQGNSDGIHLTTSSNNTIVGNTCQGNTGNGIYLYVTCSNNTITGNTCQGNGATGIVLSTSSSPNNTITGNTCQGNTANGISIMVSNNCVVTGNQCRSNGTHGIYVYRSSYCTITGNGCYGQTTGDGINVTGDGTANADYNTVTGNVCQGNGDDGVAIEGGANANKNIVVANQLLTNTGTPLVDNGTNTEIGHNITV